MTLKLDKFEECPASRFGTDICARFVDTPMPENGNSGYTTEENEMLLYTKGNHFVKVSKISNLGWSVSHYVKEDGELSLENTLDKKVSKARAKELAAKAVCN